MAAITCITCFTGHLRFLSTAVSSTRPWRLDGLRRLREGHAHAIFVQRRLELVSNRLMHHWSVPVTLNVFVVSLQILAPLDFANFVTRHWPILEVVEMFLELVSLLVSGKVYEGVAKTNLVF